MKLNEPRNDEILGPTASRCRKAIVGDRIGKVSGDPGGVVRHGMPETDMSGTREIQQGLEVEYADRMSVCLRNAKALLEVGPTGSTLSAGKPRTWGSGGAVEALFRDTSSALGGGAR